MHEDYDQVQGRKCAICQQSSPFLHSSRPQDLHCLRVSAIYPHALLSKLMLLACFKTSKATVNLRVDIDNNISERLWKERCVLC
jgi:hypothetical protein